MDNVKIKTETAMSYELSDNIKTFILVFNGIIWRRVWITTVVYCEHNKVSISKNIVLMSLKFNIYANVGIYNTLKPYIRKALGDGFLMPNFYRENLYATRAVNLYKSGYEIVKKRNIYDEIKFLKDCAFKVFDSENIQSNDILEETNDIISSIEKSEKYDATKDISPINTIDEKLFPSYKKNMCRCKMCYLVNSWDISEGLIFSDDIFQNTIMKVLSSVL
jgi:hypothetical protein